MKRIAFYPVLLLACWVATTSTARGQEAGATHVGRIDAASALGAGGFLDWIHRLSGPEFGMRNPGMELSYGYQHRAGRSGIDRGQGFRAFVRHVSGSDTADITMRSYSLSVERVFPPLWKFYLGLEAGAALHHFQHPDFDDFVHWSFPVLVHLYPAPYGVDVAVLGPVLRGLRISGGAHIFPAFDDDAFAPAFDWTPGGTELVPTFMISLDLIRVLY